MRLRKLREYYANPLAFTKPDSLRLFNGSVELDMVPLHHVLDVQFAGEGHFARVFAFNRRWVLKVTTQRDDGYDEFAKFCMEVSNPWVPRIRARIELRYDLRAYIVERLERASPERTEVLRTYCREPDKAPCEKLRALLYDFGTENFTDLHPANIMQRHDGQLVFTDPCHYFSGRGKMRKPPPPVGRRWGDEFRFVRGPTKPLPRLQFPTELKWDVAVTRRGMRHPPIHHAHLIREENKRVARKD